MEPSWPAIDPDTLRQRLFAAVHSGDHELLFELCQDHRDLVLDHFPVWRRVPGEEREPDALERYASGLLGVASCFAERLGEPGLLEALTGSEEGDSDNPLVGWGEALERASLLNEELEYEQAVELLVDTLIDTRGLRGTGVDYYLPRTFGLLGDSYFQGGRVEQALTPTENALAACEERGDLAGIRAFLARRYEILRYLARREEAADAAEQLAALTDGRAERWFRIQARRQREGEPPCRVVLEVEGERVELEDARLERLGALRYVYVRDRPPLGGARGWVARGERWAREGDTDEALSAFRCAARVDPHDPQPHYQSGVVNLAAERGYAAVESFSRAEELSPGWFDTRAQLAIAEGVASGRLSPALPQILRRLEHPSLPASKGLALARKAEEEAPRCAPLLLLKARHLARGGEPEAALEALEAALEAAEERDVRTRLLLELALLRGAEERRQLLVEAIELKGNLVAAATASLVLRRLELESSPRPPGLPG